MSVAIWNYPTRIHFGAGALSLVPDLCDELNIRAPLLVTDDGLSGIDFIKQLLGYCCLSGKSVAMFSDVKGNPTGEQVDEGVNAFLLNECDGIIAVGGGSALDVAKTIAVIAYQERPVWTLGGKEYDWSWISSDKIVPLIALPTTAGTGSEVGHSSVIVEETTCSKKIIFHRDMVPPVVVSDPELTVGLPPHITAATGMGAFAHCFEAYCAPGFHPMAEGSALEGMRLIAEALPVAYEQGDNIDARSSMLVAAIMGATALRKGSGGVSALAHSLGAIHDIHHGLASAIILPYVMMANQSVIEPRMALPGRILNLEATDFNGMLSWLLNFREQLGLPHTLTEAGIPDIDIEKVATRAASYSGTQGDSVTLSTEQYQQIIVNALQGRIE